VRAAQGDREKATDLCYFGGGALEFDNREFLIYKFRTSGLTLSEGDVGVEIPSLRMNEVLTALRAPRAGAFAFYEVRGIQGSNARISYTTGASHGANKIKQ
jgi:hypothetical protein